MGHWAIIDSIVMPYRSSTIRKITDNEAMMPSNITTDNDLQIIETPAFQLHFNYWITLKKLNNQGNMETYLSVMNAVTLDEATKVFENLRWHFISPKFNKLEMKSNVIENGMTETKTIRESFRSRDLERYSQL